MHVVFWTSMNVDILLNASHTSFLVSAGVFPILKSKDYSLEFVSHFHHEREPGVENHGCNDGFSLAVEPLSVEIGIISVENWEALI